MVPWVGSRLDLGLKRVDLDPDPKVMDLDPTRTHRVQK